MELKTDKATVDAQIAGLANQLDDCIKARDHFGQQVKHLQDEAAQFRKENYALYQQNFKLQGDLSDARREIAELRTRVTG